MAVVGSFEATVLEYDGEPLEIDFCGETFSLSNQVGGMPLLRFAHQAKSGTDANELEGLDAMYCMIRDCIGSPEEWERFQEVATEKRASTADLMKVCRGIWQALSARPTTLPSDSSAGQSKTTTGPSSSSKRSRSKAKSTKTVTTTTAAIG